VFPQCTFVTATSEAAGAAPTTTMLSPLERLYILGAWAYIFGFHITYTLLQVFDAAEVRIILVVDDD
jgi:hypothetical protein